MSAEEVCLLRDPIKDIKKNINQLLFLLNEDFLEKPCPTSKVCLFEG